MTSRYQPPGWATAHEKTRQLPWRKVVARRPAEQGTWEYSIWEIETLECGHEHQTGTRAQKRRCWQCGPQQEA